MDSFQRDHRSAWETVTGDGWGPEARDQRPERGGCNLEHRTTVAAERAAWRHDG